MSFIEKRNIDGFNRTNLIYHLLCFYDRGDLKETRVTLRCETGAQFTAFPNASWCRSARRMRPIKRSLGF